MGGTIYVKSADDYQEEKYGKYEGETPEERDARLQATYLAEMDQASGTGDPYLQEGFANESSRGYGTSTLVDAWEAAGNDPEKMQPAAKAAWYEYQNRKNAEKPLETGTTDEAYDEMERHRGMGYTNFQNQGDIDQSRGMQDDYLGGLRDVASGRVSPIGEAYDTYADNQRGSLASLGQSARGGYSSSGTRGTQNAISGVEQGLAGQRAIAQDAQRMAAEQAYAKGATGARDTDITLDYGTGKQDSEFAKFREEEAFKDYGRGAEEKFTEKERSMKVDAVRKGWAIDEKAKRARATQAAQAKIDAENGMAADIFTGGLKAATMGIVDLTGTSPSNNKYPNGVDDMSGSSDLADYGAEITDKEADDLLDFSDDDVSDKNAKKDFKPAGGDLDDYLDKLGEQSTWSYNDSEYGDTSERRAGPMAQDLEKSEIGKNLVTEKDGVKRIDYIKGLPAHLAATARLNQRIKKLEAQLAGDDMSTVEAPKGTHWADAEEERRNAGTLNQMGVNAAMAREPMNREIPMDQPSPGFEEQAERDWAADYNARKDAAEAYYDNLAGFEAQAVRDREFARTHGNRHGWPSEEQDLMAYLAAERGGR